MLRLQKYYDLIGLLLSCPTGSREKVESSSTFSRDKLDRKVFPWERKKSKCACSRDHFPVPVPVPAAKRTSGNPP